LKRRTPVRAYVGSAEILGTLAFEAVPEQALPVRATLRLRKPTVVVPGAAFVVRRLSPKTLLGGGTIAGVDAAVAGASDDSAETSALLAALGAAGIAGLDASHAGAAANVRSEVARDVLEALVDEGRALRLQRPAAYVHADAAQRLFERVHAHLVTAERDLPWSAGATALALSRALAVPETALARVLTTFAEDGRIAHRAGYYATPGFAPELSPEQRVFFERLFLPDASAPDAPLALEAVRSAMHGAKILGIAQAFETLLASGALVRVDDAVYRGEQVARLRARLETALRKDGRITVSAFRELVGTSRKFAVPLLEWFDATGVTIRSGDVRMLRAKSQ
jgi:selenocysteine-specific elongation factor